LVGLMKSHFSGARGKPCVNSSFFTLTGLG
jgi:hypothetical protein